MSRVTAKLARAFDDDLGVSVVLFDGPTDLHDASLQSANIANAFQVAMKNNRRERADAVIITEIQMDDAVFGLRHVHNFAGNAPSLADVFGGFLNLKAVSPEERGSAEEQAAEP